MLVVCFDAIGDFILSLPAIEALRRRYPGVTIELLCSPRNQALARAIEGVAACHAITLNDRLLDRDGWRQLRALRERNFDLVVNLFDEPDELAMAKMLWVAQGRLLSLPLRPKSVTQQKLLPLFGQKAREVVAVPASHFVHRMLAIVEGVVDAPLSLPTPCNQDYDTARFGDYVVVNLAGSQVGNTLPAELQGSILARLPVLGGLSYLFFSQESVGIERPDLVCIYPDSILDAATLIRDARAVLSTDTSIIHISSSFGVPTLVLMNNECWRDAFIPLAGRNIILRSATDNLAALSPAEISRQVDALMAL
ncbi:glycosyltransferase family 9 protein [Aeromonas hydrophila]